MVSVSGRLLVPGQRALAGEEGAPFAAFLTTCRRCVG